MKLKLNDTIKVTLGKDRGKTGKIEKLFPKKKAILVTDINLAKKHLKSQGQDKPGGIVDLPQPLNIAKVSLICPHCHQPSRVGYQGQLKKKIRVCRKCQKPLDGGTSKS